MPDPIPYRSPTSRKPNPPFTPVQRRTYHLLCLLGCFFVAFAALGDLWTRRLDPSSTTTALGSDIFFLLFSLSILLYLSILWLRRLLAYHEPWPARLACLGYVAIPILLLVLTCLLNLYSIPFHIAFTLSRSSLERAVLDYRADPTRPISPHTALLPIDSIRLDGPIAYVHVTNVSGIDYEPTLLWSPSPPATFRFQPLGNNWYWILQ